jgi:hypothetical protein
MCHDGPARISREEHKVAALQLSADSIADFRLADRAPRQVDAVFAVDVLRQSGAVELARTLGSPDIGSTDQAGRKGNGVC